MRGLGILATGVYLPRRRLQRSAIQAANGWFNPGLRGLAKGERAVANWDEDVITMAVEAARDCLGGSRQQLNSLVLASTTAPFSDRLNAGIVKEALNLADAVQAADVGGSQRAATTMLRSALESSGGTVLCVASELRRAAPASESEMTFGDAAAAVLVGEGPVIARLLGAAAMTVDFIDHFRASGQDHDYGWESRWVRDEGYARILPEGIRSAISSAGVDAAAIDHLIVPVTVRGVAGAIAKACGIPDVAVADPLAAMLGDTGVAHPLVMLAGVLEQALPGQRIVLAGFGQGCDALVFEVTEAITQQRNSIGLSNYLSARQPDENYIRHLFFTGALPLEKGMRAEMDDKQPLTALYRNRKTVLGLVGGRCTKTGVVQFPRSEIGVSPNDRTVGTQEDYPLAERTARIITFTADSLTYSPNPPQYYGLIEFEGGGRMMAEIVDGQPEEIVVGAPLKMVFRIKSTDEKRDFIRYFWKAVPIARGQGK